MMPNLDDLAVKAASEPEAFVQLYNAFFKRVYNYTLYRCGDAPTAEDLTGQIFERLLVYIQRYSPQKGPFEAWLFAIARNVVNNHYQRQRFPWLPWEAFRQQPDRNPSPEEQSIQREALDGLKTALKKLDRRSLDLVSLKFFARLTNRQIAVIVHMSESGVGVALYRAVNKLRGWLADEQGQVLAGCQGKELEDERT